VVSEVYDSPSAARSQDMRKLVEPTVVTLDGVIENPQDWSPSLLESTRFGSGIVVNMYT
jgi:hypothetical protein